MHSTQSIGKPKFVYSTGIGGGKGRRLEKYIGPDHSGIFQVPCIGRCSAKEKSLQGFIKQNCAFRKIILVGCTEDEQRCHM